MTDKISEKTSYSARKIGGKAGEGAKKLAKKGVKNNVANEISWFSLQCFSYL